MNKQPQLMDRSQMQHILAPDLQKLRQQVYFDNELGIVHGDSTVFKLIMKQKPPFIINDHRLGVILHQLQPARPPPHCRYIGLSGAWHHHHASSVLEQL